MGSNAGVLLLEAAVLQCNNGSIGCEATVCRRLMAMVKCYYQWTAVTAVKLTATSQAANHRWQRPRIWHIGILTHPSRTTRLPNPNVAESLFPSRPQPWLRFQLPSQRLSRLRPRPQPRSQPRSRRIVINVPILLAFRTNFKVWLNIKAATRGSALTCIRYIYSKKLLNLFSKSISLIDFSFSIFFCFCFFTYHRYKK